MSALSDVLLPAQWLRQQQGQQQGQHGESGSMFSSNTLMLVFFKTPGGAGAALGPSPGPALVGGGGARELLVSPMLLDCAKLRQVLLEVKAAFAQVR